MIVTDAIIAKGFSDPRNLYEMLRWFFGFGEGKILDKRCVGFLMHYRRFGDVFVLRFDTGEEIVSTLVEFCERERIRAGTVSAIGAAKEIEIAAFDVSTKRYSKKELKENHEILSLKGLISSVDGKPHAHLHISVAGHDFAAEGGHLNKAVVSPTCEMVVRKFDGELSRKQDEETGLKLLEP